MYLLLAFYMPVYTKFSKTAFPALALLFRPLSSLNTLSPRERGSWKIHWASPVRTAKASCVGGEGGLWSLGGKWLEQEWRRPHQFLQRTGSHLLSCRTGRLDWARSQASTGGQRRGGGGRRGCGCRGWAWGLRKLGGLVDG